MNPEQWLSLKWNGGSTMSDRWLNQSKIIQKIGIKRRRLDIFMVAFFVYPFSLQQQTSHV